MPQRLHMLSTTYCSRLLLPVIALSSALGQISPQDTRSPSPSISLPGSQSPFLGSEPEGKPTAEVLQIDFKDAIDRGLRTNLGLLLAGDQTIAARGERWKQLSELLPNVQARIQENVQTQSLAALGFGKIFQTPIRVIGPYSYFDARVNLSQSVFSFKNIENARSAAEELKSAQLNYKDARELVVLAVGNVYL